MLSCTPFVGRSRADSSPCHKNSKCPRAPLQTLSSSHDPHAKKEIIPIFPSLLAVLTVDRPHFEPGSGTSPLFALESCNYGFPFPSLPQLPSNSSQMPLTETTDGECDLPCQDDKGVCSKPSCGLERHLQRTELGESQEGVGQMSSEFPSSSPG